METEKVLCYGSLAAAGLVVLIFLLDVALKIPFGRASIVLDILFIIGGAFILWQGYETYRELR
jgi:threonine/homoserine/homoserine lactone efflux protein